MDIQPTRTGSPSPRTLHTTPKPRGIFDSYTKVTETSWEPPLGTPLPPGGMREAQNVVCETYVTLDNGLQIPLAEGPAQVLDAQGRVVGQFESSALKPAYHERIEMTGGRITQGIWVDGSTEFFERGNKQADHYVLRPDGTGGISYKPGFVSDLRKIGQEPDGSIVFFDSTGTLPERTFQPLVPVREYLDAVPDPSRPYPLDGDPIPHFTFVRE